MSNRPAQERHVPVLLQRCVDLLAPALQTEGAVVVDTTLGMGGHSEALLTHVPGVRLVGIDRDPQAIALAGERLAPFADRVQLVQAVYDEFDAALDGLGIGVVHGVLMDLGVSSLQLDEAERGFAYAHDAPLDMRMTQGEGMTAADVLNTYSVPELIRVLRVYGEERFAARIARAVDAERAREPFSSSARLVQVVRESIPAAARREGGNPAKRTFQALRIEVNDELGALERALPQALSRLAIGGRIVVESYQSLEDKIVKSALAEVATSAAPPGLPFEPPELAAEFTLLAKGEKADGTELLGNPRAASVRLRAAERVAPPRASSLRSGAGARRSPRSRNRRHTAPLRSETRWPPVVVAPASGQANEPRGNSSEIHRENRQDTPAIFHARSRKHYRMSLVATTRSSV